MTQFFDAIPVPVPDHSRELQRLIPVPESREWNLSFPFPFPKIGNGICHSRSHSQKLGMLFFIPVPKIWEWVEQFPFPFPKSKNHSRSPLAKGPGLPSIWKILMIMLKIIIQPRSAGSGSTGSGLREFESAKALLTPPPACLSYSIQFHILSNQNVIIKDCFVTSSRS